MRTARLTCALVGARAVPRASCAAFPAAALPKRSLVCTPVSRSVKPVREPYGAPYTTSIKFQPSTSSAGDAAGGFELTVAIPDLPGAVVALNPGDSLSSAINQLKTQLAESDIKFLRNGKRCSAAELEGLTLEDLFSCTAEFEINGIRYSVNEGRRLSPSGSIYRRSASRSYLYVTAGAALMLVSCLSFWKFVIPEASQRKY
jgi:hypothetical protein